MRAERGGIEYVVTFDVEGRDNQVLEWNDSKLAVFNCLLCISSDGFQTFSWVVISTRRLRGLCPKTAIGLRPLKGLEFSMEDGVEYVMCESATSFFEAYQNVLKVLQKPEMEKLSFLKHLVDLEPDVAESNDLSDESYGWDPCGSDVDRSQKAAIKHGLSKNLAIIQGPAGRGKTFVGLFITKELLENSDIRGPIVVVCYTSRALDQFLEGIFEYEPSLVRLGTGSKSRKLRQRSFEKLRKKSSSRLPKFLRREASRLGSIQDYMASKMNLCASCMHAKKVSRVAKEEVVDSLYCCNDCRAEDLFDSWLAGKQRGHPTFPCPLLTGDSAITRAMQNSAVEIIDIPDDEDAEELTLHPASACPSSTVDATTINTMRNSSAEVIGIPDDDDEDGDPLAMLFCTEYIWHLEVGSRLVLHQRWLCQIRLHGQQEFWNSVPEYESIGTQMSEIRVKIQLHLLNTVKVLGMTTTVAARSYDILQALHPQVIIIEKAAETLQRSMRPEISTRCVYSSQDITVLSMHRTQIEEISKRFRQAICPTKEGLCGAG